MVMQRDYLAAGQRVYYTPDPGFTGGRVVVVLDPTPHRVRPRHLVVRQGGLPWEPHPDGDRVIVGDVYGGQVVAHRAVSLASLFPDPTGYPDTIDVGGPDPEPDPEPRKEQGEVMRRASDQGITVFTPGEIPAGMWEGYVMIAADELAQLLDRPQDDGTGG